MSELDNTMLENNEEHQKSMREEHGVAKTIGWILTAVCLFAVGWLSHALFGPKKDEAGMQMPTREALVEVYTVEEEIMNPPSAFIGHVEPMQDVALRAQISGYVKEVRFKEGSLVKEGDLLFTIEPEQYEAVVAVRKAEIQQAEAGLERAQSYLKRLEASDARSITQMDLDTARSDVAQGEAALQQAKANLVLAEIDLRHTRITAPISGRVGRTVAYVGDYVSPAIGTLVRIVQMDPIRVAFSVTDRDLVASRESGGGKEQRIRVQLPTGTVLEKTGVQDFADNVMSIGTASLSVRARFENTDELLLPDAYVTVLVDHLHPEKHPVVPQLAVKTDNHGTYVYVVDAENTASRCDVEVVANDEGRMAVKGLKAGERVVTLGIQSVHPGAKVRLMESEEAGL